MKTIRYLLAIILCTLCGPAWAQTNAPAKKAQEQQLFITSTSAYYDGITNQMVYIGHVFVTDKTKAWLNCERLTVDVPPNGEHPTNIVAETNVVVDVLDEKGQNSHITAKKAVYNYQIVNAVTNTVNTMANVVGAVTNETITFTGGDPHPVFTNAVTIGSAEPIIIHIIDQKYKIDFPAYVDMRMNIKSTGNGTNGSPLDILK